MSLNARARQVKVRDLWVGADMPHLGTVLRAPVRSETPDHLDVVAAIPPTRIPRTYSWPADQEVWVASPAIFREK